MTTPNDVGVVVITWNDDPALLATAISSALNQSEVREVVVVDNGSEPAALVPNDPRARLIRNASNLGVAAARNQGVQACSSELVLLLDSDARLHDGAVALLAAPLSADDIGAVVPTFTGQPATASAGRAPHLVRKAARVAGITSTYRATPRSEADEWWDVDFGIGACQLFRHSAFDAVGGIDETYFYGPEDVDFCLRIREAGWRVVQTAATCCDHPPRRRNRRLLTRRGLVHAGAVLRYLWRHRRHLPVARPS